MGFPASHPYTKVINEMEAVNPPYLAEVDVVLKIESDVL
jgi:hypothetical protein